LDLMGERKPALLERSLLAGRCLGALVPRTLLDADRLEACAASRGRMQKLIHPALLRRLGPALLREGQPQGADAIARNAGILQRRKGLARDGLARFRFRKVRRYLARRLVERGEARVGLGLALGVDAVALAHDREHTDGVLHRGPGLPRHD